MADEVGWMASCDAVLDALLKDLRREGPITTLDIALEAIDATEGQSNQVSMLASFFATAVQRLHAAERDDSDAALPSTPEGVGELVMHNGEALAWIAALERWIRAQGLDVPTWADLS